MVSNVKRVILSVSIAIILALFVGYGISTFYKSPRYENFCEDKPIPVKQNITEEYCNLEGGVWISAKSLDNGETVPEGWCDFYKKCSEEYNSVNEIYNKNVFVIAVIAGLISLLFGGILLKLESVSSGIMGGGALTIIYGIIRYWGDAPDILRFVILGIVLAILIFVGYKKIEASGKKK